MKRYEFIGRAITREILRGRLLPGQKLPGERILAERFSANVQTVNKAISTLVSSGQLRRDRSVGTYVSNNIDIQNLRSSFHATVAIIFDGSIETITDAGRTLARIAYNLQNNLSNQGFNWIIASSQERLNFSNYLDIADACITIGNIDQVLVQHIIQLGIPAVTFNRDYTEYGFGAVMLDTAPIRGVIRRMYKNKHRSFLFVSNTALAPYSANLDRYTVFKHTTEELGVSRDNDILIVSEESLSGGTLPSGVEKRLRDCDFIFAAYSHLAVKLLNAILNTGIRVPQDLAITGFDDTISTRLCRKPLSTFAYDISSVCNTMIHKLHNLLFGFDEELLSVVETNFVSRESTRLRTKKESISVLPA